MIAMTSVNLLAAVFTVNRNKKFIPDFSRVSAKRLKGVFSSVGWNGAAVASVNLYLRFDVFAVNIFFGVAGTVVFGLASQLSAYTRQVTMGLITGLDAVVSQKSGKLGSAGRKSIVALSQRVFELQSISLFCVGVVLCLHAEFIIQLLFGARLSTADAQVPVIAQSFVFMMFGMIARGLSEGWMSILAGSGRIRDYGLPVLIGALLNPVLVVLFASVLDKEAGFLSVSIIFMILNIIFHMIAVPAVTARYFGIGLFGLLSTGLRPAFFAVAAGLAAYFISINTANEWISLIATISLVSLTFGVWFFRSFVQLIKMS